MRRFDKQKNLARVNLLTEQRYLKSKGFVTENQTTEDVLIGLINDAFEKIKNGTPYNKSGVGDLLARLKNDYPDRHAKMIEKYSELVRLYEDYKNFEHLNEEYKFTDLEFITFLLKDGAYNVGELKNIDESKNSIKYFFGLDKREGENRKAVGGQVIYYLDKDGPQKNKMFINDYHDMIDVRTGVDNGEEVFKKMSEFIEHNPSGKNEN